MTIVIRGFDVFCGRLYHIIQDPNEVNPKHLTLSHFKSKTLQLKPRPCKLRTRLTPIVCCLSWQRDKTHNANYLCSYVRFLMVVEHKFSIEASPSNNLALGENRSNMI